MAEPSSTKELPLPSGFVTIEDILEGKKPYGSLVNIIGLVSDFRAPTPTRKQDWKCQISLYDKSIQYDHERFLEVNFFDSKEEMPEANRGDVVVVSQAKVQSRAGAVSLLTSKNTTNVHIFSASKIPRLPADASVALMPPFKKTTKRPSTAECQFVSSIYHRIDKERLPTEMEFERLKIQSANIKEKFSLLQQVQDCTFCDLIVQVVKDPYDAGDRITLWVSDFTENSAFYHHSFAGVESAAGPDGDPFGYQDRFSKPKLPTTGFTGPFGKRSMQLTLWEPHATTSRGCQIAAGSWVSLRNVHIKYGNNGANLEGVLREDRGAYSSKVQLSKLDPTDDPENIDPRLKDTLRRKRDYEIEKKHQLKSITEAAKAGQKRKSNMGIDPVPSKKNANARRKAKRAHLNKAEKQEMESPMPASDLKPLVKCDNQNKEISSVAQILESVYYATTIGDQVVKLPLPFVNTNHRTNVRVVDFKPSKLEDFACPKKTSGEFDVLSDNEESDSGSDSEQDVMADFTTVQDWEWRFYLALEDAAVRENEEKKTVWVVVDNSAAQCLMDLDATNLRHDRKNLDALREKLFHLWGNMEEHKSRRASKSARNTEQDRPPVDSEDEDHGPTDQTTEQITNQPFSCCIRQYGVKVSEDDLSKADAGEGKRWQRMFGLFGARISDA